MQRFLIAVLVCCLASSAFAWNKAGHMVIGAVAYDELAADHPRTLAKLIDVLHGHPQWAGFEKKLQTVEPENRDRYLLMIASRWPDDIRDDKSLTHPTWHYIDYGIESPGDTQPVDPPAAENAVSALTAQVGILRDAAAKPGDRGIAVCWIEHIVGDLHQPLHTVSLFSAKLPKGDRGGNDEWVKIDAQSQTVNLHSLWDSLLTSTENYKDAANIATELRSRPGLDRKSLAEAKDLSPDDWVKESVDIAYKVAYINGTLKGGTKQQGVLLPEGYGKTAKAAAERRVALAGYRLSDAIVRMLGE